MADTSRPPKSFTDLINCWGSAAEFARATSQPYERVKRWRAVNSIPAKYWPAIKRAAARNAFDFIDDALLVRLATAAAKKAA